MTTTTTTTPFGACKRSPSPLRQTFRERMCMSTNALLLLLILLLCKGAAEGQEDDGNEQSTIPMLDSYGVDISFPMHYDKVRTGPLGGEKQEFYDYFLQGCRDKYPGKNAHRCDDNERNRLAMNLQQPRAMQNYTSAGYAKLRVPKKIMALLTSFWNINSEKQAEERWPIGNTYTNHWESPTYMLPISNSNLQGGGPALVQSVLEQVQIALEAWTGQSLVSTSTYGVRVYTAGSVLAPHVDRLPLVSSAIINVAQDVDEPWILEVIGHDGKAANLTMEPGDMVLYESHSVIHGRPYPLNGLYYANLFVHMEPYGYTERHAAQAAYGTMKSDVAANHNHAKKTKELYEEAFARTTSKAKPQPRLPDYILAGSEEEKMWMQQYVYQVDKSKPKTTRALGPSTTSAHSAAAMGDLVVLKDLAKKDPSSLHTVDHNGWLPLHEAARAGKTDVVDYLIRMGADVNARTNNGRGGSPLWWAQQMLEDAHPTVRLLKQHGATRIDPEK